MITQMHRNQFKESRITKYQIDMIPPKKTNKAPVSHSIEVESYDKEFRTIILRHFSGLQENRQLNKNRKSIHEQNEKFIRKRQL